MVFVTGSTGFIGNHVARLLARRGERLRLLVRRSSDLRCLDGLRAEVCYGDLLDRDSVQQAVTGCSTVFHVAAMYCLWTKDPSALYATNVDGTRHVLEAARAAAVDRVVCTSSVGSIAPNRDGSPVTEERRSRVSDLTGHYKRSKFLAEQLALQAAQDGLDVVIVNPTAPVGERDFRPTPTGRIVLDFLQGRMPAYLDTGLNFVDVRDVARGHWLAAQRGRKGQRYLLGSENLSLRQLLETLAEISGKSAPCIRMPYAAAWTVGACCALWSRVTGLPPAVPLDGVRMARHRMFADCRKAGAELGYRPVPVRDALERAVSWFEAARSVADPTPRRHC